MWYLQGLFLKARGFSLSGWKCRSMKDFEKVVQPNHSTKNLKFLLLSGKGGILKTISVSIKNCKTKVGFSAIKMINQGYHFYINGEWPCWWGIVSFAMRSPSPFFACFRSKKVGLCIEGSTVDITISAGKIRFNLLSRYFCPSLDHTVTRPLGSAVNSIQVSTYWLIYIIRVC